MLKKGTVITKKYIIREALGEGGSSEVYLAGKVQGDGLYTLKISHNRELLKKEARLVGEIGSRYFPAFVDYEEEGDEGYLVLEYIEGTSLQKMLDGGRRFTEEEIFLLMEHVTAALSVLHFHKTPLVHLDVKPANIIISPRGEVKLIDMGAGSIVGLTQQKKGGTYGYGAPEQFWHGALPGPQADVYACGKLLSYLLTGKNPALPPYNVEMQILRGSRRDKRWQKIITKCLEMEPGRRYPDGRSLHKEIRMLQERGRGWLKRTPAASEETVYIKCLWKSDYERV